MYSNIISFFLRYFKNKKFTRIFFQTQILQMYEKNKLNK